MLTKSQNKMVQILSLLKEISKSKDKETDKQPDEIEESVAQEEQSAKGLEILTSNQMLSRLPISLAQLNAGSNSEKLKNEIRQLLYSLYK